MRNAPDKICPGRLLLYKSYKNFGILFFQFLGQPDRQDQNGGNRNDRQHEKQDNRHGFAD